MDNNEKTERLGEVRPNNPSPRQVTPNWQNSIQTPPPPVRKKGTFIIIGVLVAAILIVGSVLVWFIYTENKPSSPLEGVWENRTDLDEDYITVTEYAHDFTFESTSISDGQSKLISSGTYSVEENKVTLNFDYTQRGVIEKQEATFTINGNELTLSNVVDYYANGLVQALGPDDYQDYKWPTYTRVDTSYEEAISNAQAEQTY